LISLIKAGARIAVKSPKVSDHGTCYAVKRALNLDGENGNFPPISAIAGGNFGGAKQTSLATIYSAVCANRIGTP